MTQLGVHITKQLSRDVKNWWQSNSALKVMLLSNHDLLLLAASVAYYITNMAAQTNKI